MYLDLAHLYTLDSPSLSDLLGIRVALTILKNLEATLHDIVLIYNPHIYL
jgi:hypothetical protein